jgi:hypothetical protein
VKLFRKLAFFAFVSIFVLGIPAGIHWLTSGQWPKDFWLEVLIFLATCAVISIHEQLQEIFSVVSEIQKQGAEVQEKLERVEESISEINGRLLRRVN